MTPDVMYAEDDIQVCDCTADDPCSSDKCLNRLMLFECDRRLCPAGDKCQNQVAMRSSKFAVSFMLRLRYPPLVCSVTTASAASSEQESGR